MNSISDKQVQILAFGYTSYYALICDGAVRSGKSSFMMIGFIDWAMRTFNHKNFAICGKTVTSAYKNVVVPYLNLSYAKKKYTLNYKHTENKLTVTAGNVTNTFYIYGGKDESSYALIQGITLAGLLMDEVVLMCRSFVEQAVARCSVEGSKLWFNCNPDSPEHWFYREWICKCKEKNALHIHFLMTDNPSLSDEMIARYESYWKGTGTFYDKYIKGEWTSADGLVYANFDKSIHVCDTAARISELLQSTRQQSRQSTPFYYVSCDYGITNPFAALLWCVIDGYAFVIKEYYYNHTDHNGKKKTDTELYSALHSLCQGYDIEYVIVDPSASSFIELAYQKGEYDVLKASNKVIPGLEYTMRMFNAGRLLIDQSCVNLIRELFLYSWDENSVTDSVLKENDHACDAMRYFCYTVYRKIFGDYLLESDD